MGDVFTGATNRVVCSHNQNCRRRNMQKKFTPFILTHLVLMSVLAIMSIVGTVQYFGAAAAHTGSMRTFGIMIACVQIVNAIALAFGLIYLLRGYEKRVALYYKLFLASMVVACTLACAANALVSGFTISILFMTLKIIVLLVLIIVKDIGERNTWILFMIMVAIDLVLGSGFLFPANLPGMTLYKSISALSRLLIDGTIGLAIRGKYADKASRGTK